MTRDPALWIVDAEAGGDVSRVIVGGAPALAGSTVAEKCIDFAARYDHLRWKLIRPPHGELHMCPVLLLDAAGEDADFGVIIMESMGYPPISGSNLFCAVAVALETGVVTMREPSTSLRVATPGGIVAVEAHCRNGRCETVEFMNTPSRIKSTVQTVNPTGSSLLLTVVAAGVDYAVVDAEHLGVPLAPESHDSLSSLGKRLAATAGTDFVLFHEAVTAGMGSARCRVAVFQAPSVVCRSPTGTGTSAMLTLAYARRILPAGGTMTTQSPFGGEFHGRIVSVDSTPEADVLHTAVSGRVRTGDTLTIH